LEREDWALTCTVTVGPGSAANGAARLAVQCRSMAAERQQIFSVIDEEAAAIEAGDIGRYLALLSDDAVFLPPSLPAKTGDDLHGWLRDFLERVAIHYLDLTHGETEIREDLAYQAFTCSWTATPKSGGQPAVMHFKGIHILRRQARGAWKIWREIWNTSPAPAGAP
jgi:ketosteroid isomerase-like protein